MIVADPRRGDAASRSARRDPRTRRVDHVPRGEPAADVTDQVGWSNYPAIMGRGRIGDARVRGADLPSARATSRGETTAEFNEQIEFRGISFEYEASEAVLATWISKGQAHGQVVRSWSVRSGEDDAGRPLAAVLRADAREILLDGGR